MLHGDDREPAPAVCLVCRVNVLFDGHPGCVDFLLVLVHEDLLWIERVEIPGRIVHHDPMVDRAVERQDRFDVDLATFHVHELDVFFEPAAPDLWPGVGLLDALL